MRIPNNRRLSDLRMCHQRAFDFGGAHTVPRDVDHVIDTTGNPVIAVFVTATTVTGKVVTFVVREIGLLKPLMVTPNSPHLTGPAVFDAQNTFDAIARDFRTRSRFQHHRFNTKERFHRRTRLHRMRAGQGSH